MTAAFNRSALRRLPHDASVFNFAQLAVLADVSVMEQILNYAEDDFEASWISLAATTRNAVEMLRMRKSCISDQSKEKSGATDKAAPQLPIPSSAAGEDTRIGVGDAVMIPKAELVCRVEQDDENTGKSAGQNKEREQNPCSGRENVERGLSDLAEFRHRARLLA
jgi:hypothetical protein